MTHPDFAHVDTWIFDLDHTLYPPDVRLFDQIEVKMRHFVADFLGVDFATADELRGRYWADHGTTLAGMMHHHDMPPEAFLEDVHDIDFSVLSTDDALTAMIEALPGRKLVYTNGTRPYAQNVLAGRGLDHLLDEVYGIEHAGFIPKPETAAFEMVFDLAQVNRTTAVMFEDDPRNLAVPHQMGLKTVLVGPHVPNAPHIDLQAVDLNAALQQIATPPSPRGTS